MTGRIHSFQSMGAVDGPGLRCVIFFQGCPLRCAYCHNPDSWDFSAGTQSSVEELVQRVLRFRPYFGQRGGVTLSGGEPLAQPVFGAELLKALKAQDIHTALDTCGHGSENAMEQMLAYTDLVLCDVKFTTEEAYHTHTGGSLNKTLSFLEKVQEKGIPTHLRHVVVPGLTDDKENITRLVDIAQRFSVVKKIELLPFRTLCLEKYEKMGIPFPLAGTPDCAKELLQTCSRWLPKEYL